jgi:hypothetical protein
MEGIPNPPPNELWAVEPPGLGRENRPASLRGSRHQVYPNQPALDERRSIGKPELASISILAREALSLASSVTPAAAKASGLSRSGLDLAPTERLDRRPDVLARSHSDQWLQQFCDEYAPCGPTEWALVRQLARHAAGAERWEEATGASERQAGRYLPDFMNGTSSLKLTPCDGSADDQATVKELETDRTLMSALSTDAAVRGERYSLLRSRAFLRTLEELRIVQATRRAREERSVSLPPLGFADEADCEQYLADRFHNGLLPCSRCGATSGCPIISRKVWECHDCHLQTGLRANTVMARSPVPLLQWFNAIRYVLWRPSISPVELGKEIGLQRTATVRQVLGKIHAALRAEDASPRLAGLDRHYAVKLTPPEPSVSRRSNARVHEEP